jgi:hypothetical protein
MRNKILTIVLVLFSPIIYFYLTLWFVTHVAYPIIHTFAVKTLIMSALVFILSNAICAVITAFITALPCGYLSESNPKYIVILLLIAILGLPVFVYFMRSNFDSFTSIVFFGQCVSVLIVVYYFANVGYRTAQNRVLQSSRK